MTLMVSISGVRGITNSSLTTEVVKKFSFAFAEYNSRGLIIVSRDGRPSGKEISKIVTEVLSGAGCKVIDIGVTPTPTLQMAVEKFNASGGIAVTASHNPAEWNGLKFLNSNGMFLNKNEQANFLKIYENIKSNNFSSSTENIFYDNTLLEYHLNKTTSLPYFNFTNINKKLKVVVDTVNASGSIIIPELLNKFNCQVIPLACDSSGIFPHTPEPLPKNLTLLMESVKLNKADLGIAIDPDADRLVLITEKGEPFIEEYSIVAATDFVLRKSNSELKKVVTNLSTTRAIDDICKKYNATIFRTPVGEINVATKMKEIGAIIGGEGSGGIILSESHFGRDAIVGTALIIQSLLDFNGTCSELKKTFPEYNIVKETINVTNVNTDELLTKIIDQYNSSGKINTDDGVKIDFENSWLHMRKSNTEPIIRLIAESPTISSANKLLNEVKQILQ